MISIIMTSIWIIRMIRLMIMMIMIIIMLIVIMNIMVRVNMMMAIIVMIIVMMIMTTITIMMLRPRDDVDHQDDHDAPPSPLDSYRRYPAGAGRDLFASWDEINIIFAFQDRTSPVRKK